MNIEQYPVTTPFGQVAGYPLNNGFHNGIDYGLPMNTPVIVNGVTIGLSNNTGASTGPHLHVGKYASGAVQDPGVGNGFTFTSAVVFDTGYSAVNGNYVRITGDGALWNYLHMNKVTVNKGQKLEGGEMPVTKGDIDNLYPKLLKRPADDGAYGYVGKDWHDFIYDLVQSDEFNKLNQSNAVVDKQTVLEYIQKKLT